MMEVERFLFFALTIAIMQCVGSAASQKGQPGEERHQGRRTWSLQSALGRRSDSQMSDYDTFDYQHEFYNQYGWWPDRTEYREWLEDQVARQGGARSDHGFQVASDTQIDGEGRGRGSPQSWRGTADATEQEVADASVGQASESEDIEYTYVDVRLYGNGDTSCQDPDRNTIAFCLRQDEVRMHRAFHPVVYRSRATESTLDPFARTPFAFCKLALRIDLSLDYVRPSRRQEFLR